MLAEKYFVFSPMLVMQTSPSDNEGDRTFINKLKRLFSKDPVTNLYEPKLYFVSQTIFGGSIAGFFIGGRIGARVGAVEHIETTKLAIYQSPTHAHVCTLF